MAISQWYDAGTLREHLVDTIASLYLLDGDAVRDDSHLVKDLGLDSLDLVELLAKMQRDLNVNLSHVSWPKELTVRNVVASIGRQLMATREEG